jgi:hypothetical protein
MPGETKPLTFAETGLSHAFFDSADHDHDDRLGGVEIIRPGSGGRRVRPLARASRSDGVWRRGSPPIVVDFEYMSTA